jgi:hypothetical protein
MSDLEKELEQKGEQEIKEQVDKRFGGSSGGDQQSGASSDEQQSDDPNAPQNPDAGAGNQS